MFRSLRFRLIMMFVVIFGVVQVTLSTAAFISWERQQRTDFDSELLQRSENMAMKLAESQRRMLKPDLAKIMAAETRTSLFRDFFVQVRGAGGEVIEKSGNLGVYQLPFEPSRAQQVEGFLDFQTLAGPEVRALLVRDEGRMRMVTRYIYIPPGRSLYLQLAAGLDEMESSIVRSRLLLLAGVPMGLFAAAVASWFVTARAVDQIHAVSSLASQVRPGQLDQRLKTPTRDDEIGQMVAHVNAMLGRLEAGFAAQDRFIHDASHELKTPLSTMLAEAQVLKMIEATPDQWRRFIVSVEQEVKHLGRVVDSLLVLARSQGQSERIAHEVASLNDAVERAVDECEAAAEQAGVKLSLNLAMPDDDGEPEFSGDSNLVVAMVSNLVRNAVRFSPRDKPVDILVDHRNGQGTITVQDRGPGVPPEMLSRIFDRFAQAPGQSTHRGAGLGLAIAAQIARLHDGSISVANRDGGGCAFVVSLKLHSGNGPVNPHTEPDQGAAGA